MPLAEGNSKSRNVWALVMTILGSLTTAIAIMWSANQNSCNHKDVIIDSLSREVKEARAMTDTVLIHWKNEGAIANDMLTKQREMYFRMFDSLLQNQYALKQGVEGLYNRQTKIIKQTKK